METDSAPKAATRRPWPLTWVAGAIIVYIALYTMINFGFRKSEPAHEPWAEARDRATEAKHEGLLNWTILRPTLQNLALEDAPPIENAASVSREPEPGDLEKELPIELVLIIPARPSLAPAPAEVSAPSLLSSQDRLPCRLRFAPEQVSAALGEFLAYAKDNHLQLFLQDEARPNHESGPFSVHGTAVEVLFPAQAFSPGEWRATLHCRGAAFKWRFTVE